MQMQSTVDLLLKSTLPKVCVSSGPPHYAILSGCTKYFASPCPGHGKDSVRDRQMQVFNYLHVFRWNDGAFVAQLPHEPSLKSCDSKRRCASLARDLQGINDIARVSTSTDCKSHVLWTYKIR